ncbi:MAG: HEAT repeat domain-containing protein [Gemmatimonadota bacterium]|nr:HEAT repeat domain-containing protein [Gemmatimonadota bacterium]MDH5198868.1 HEAT repeat domain-containing protein [Gemmatimonadota bacterium]
MTDAGATDWKVDAAPVLSLLQAFLKALRAAQLYLPNNPVYQTAIQNVLKAFPAVWELTDRLHLVVLETELKWEGQVVLSQPRNEALAWLLFKDGVRSLELAPGAEGEELVRLLQVINRARNLPPDAEDDLLTLLWEQDFQFVKYDFIEPATDDQRPLAPEEERESVTVTRQEIEEEAEAEPETPGIVRLEDFDSTLYFLDEKDIEYLRAEIDQEYQQDLRTNTLTILFDIFELQPFPAVRAEILSIIENFIPYLLGTGDFRVVAQILRDLRVITERARELLPEHQVALRELPARLSEPDAIAQLLQALDESSELPSQQQLGDLFRELRAEALEAILDWLPRLHAESVRELLGTAVQRIAAAHPDAVAKALGSENPEIVRATVQLAGRLKLPPTVPALGGLLIGDAPGDLKVAVVEALAAIGTPSAMQQLERAVTDAHRDVRVATVRVLGARRHRAALQPVEAVVLGRDLRSADLSEKTAFFEAYGLLAGPEGVRHLTPMLVPTGLFKKKSDPEIRACAAMALGKIGTPGARAVLEAAIQDKDPLVRNAVGRALQGGR